MRAFPKRSLALGALTALATLAAPAAAAVDDKTKSYADPAEQAQIRTTAQSPKKFVETVGAGGLLEVKLGELAEKNAQSADVKEFARMMADAHAKANQKLEEMARGNGIAPPTALPAEKQASFDRLQALSGESFDREYMKMMVENHSKSVDLFREAARSSALGGDLRRFAGETLPTLESHLEMAQDLAADVG